MKQGTILFRGDIRDKGEVFTESPDYIFDGEVKNQAHFHWFTASEDLARRFTGEEISEDRGSLSCPVLTKVSLNRDLNILDLDAMSFDLKAQFEFHRDLYKYGMRGLQYNEEKLGDYEGDYSFRDLQKFLGMNLSGSNPLLNCPQTYGDFQRGVQFKQWLIERGYDGYAFTQYKEKEVAIIRTEDFDVVERIYL